MPVIITVIITPLTVIITARTVITIIIPPLPSVPSLLPPVPSLPSLYRPYPHYDLTTNQYFYLRCVPKREKILSHIAFNYD